MLAWLCPSLCPLLLATRQEPGKPWSAWPVAEVCWFEKAGGGQRLVETGGGATGKFEKVDSRQPTRLGELGAGKGSLSGGRGPWGKGVHGEGYSGRGAAGEER